MSETSTKGTIIVTGASRGIGAVIAIKLAELGYEVACLSRKGELPAVPDAAPALLARCTPYQCDVTDAANVGAVYDAIAQKGHIVGLVNNAGIHLQGPSADFPIADYEAVMATNMTAVFVSCQKAYPHLVAAGGGLIVNIGSFFDKIGVKGNVAYCASKAAVGALTRCLAVEWATQNIAVVDVAPGYIATDLNREQMESGPLSEYLKKRIPGKKPGTAADVAKLVHALFVADSRFLTGETIYFDGAQGIAH